MIYEVLHHVTADLIGSYGSRGEAFAELRGIIRHNGGEALATLLLRWFDPKRGHGGEITRGERLAESAPTAKDAAT